MRRVVLLAAIWGWSFLFIKVGLRGLTPTAVAFTRITLGMFVMLGTLRARGLRMPRDRAAWRHFAVMGVFYSALPFSLLAWSEQHITSALTAVVNACTPLFAALAAAFVLGERLKGVQLSGLLLGFVGVGVAAGVGGRDLATSSLVGVLATVAASASYGFCFAYATRHLRGVPPVIAASGQLVTAAIAIAPFALVTTARDGIHLDGRIIASMVLLGAVGTGLAYLLNYQTIALVGATRASIVTYLVPVVAVTVGVVFLSEPFRVRLLFGGALIIIGIALLQERFALRRTPTTVPPVIDPGIP